MPSIANILLQVTGDSDDARRELEAVSRDLALFGRETAEAEAEVNTTGAQASLDELRARLTAFSADDVSTEINVQIAKAMADVAVLQAELSAIDGEDVNVDVDVRRGVVEKIASLTGQVERLGGSLEEASSGGLSSFIGGIGEAFSGASIFGVSLKAIAIAAPFVIAGLVAVVGQILAVVASAASAAGGIGALAVSFGSLLLPAIALVGGAVANFAADAETAGTAAFALKGNFEDIANVFTDATSGGADALFVGLSDAIRELAPLVDSLKPAFTGLGKAGGDALRMLSKQFASPQWAEFFDFTIDSLAKLTPLFAESFSGFADILKDIATAAMPFLVKGFEGLASALNGIADKTKDIGGLRNVISGMVDSLKAWGQLAGGIADLGAAFVQVFAPFGDGIVESLAEGAHNLADWIRSSEGMERIQEFFEETGPVAREFAKLLLNIGVVLLQIGQFFAPLTATILAGANAIVEAFSDALEWIKDLDRALAFKNWGSFFSGLASAVVGALGDAADALIDLKSKGEKVFADLLAIAAKPIEFVIQFQQDVQARARKIWSGVQGVVEDVVRFVFAFQADVQARARKIWAGVKGVISDVVRFIFSLPGDMARRARTIWGAVKGVISDAINFILSLPSGLAGRAHDIWNAVRGVIEAAIEFALDLPGVGGLVSAAKAIWDAINDALPDISINIDIPTPHVPDINPFASGVRNFGGGLALVGEEGPELLNLPAGADVFTASDTRNILTALSRRVSAPLGGSGTALAPAAAGGGDTYNDIKIVSPPTGPPDIPIFLAKLNAELRARGGVGA